MKDTKINKEGIIKMFPELYDSFVPGLYYKYCNGGVAYFQGPAKATFGVNAGFNIITNTEAWFSTNSSDVRGFNSYSVATLSEVEDYFKKALLKFKYKAGVSVQYEGEIYTLTGGINVINNNISMLVQKNTSVFISIPVILSGCLVTHRIRII